jgi:hypothetical protein
MPGATSNGSEIQKPDELARIDRGLLERIRAMTEQSLEAAVGNSLTKDERAAVLERRDRIVEHFDNRIRQHGEGVLFTM